MKKIVLLIAAFSSTLAFANPQDFSLKDLKGVDSCYPQGLDRPESFGFVASGLSEETFNKVLDKVAAVYQPIFEEKDMQLDIIRLWDNPQPNAMALPHPQKPELRGIFMFGGLARHPEMTADGFTLVACHEIGHHIGGAPAMDKGTWTAANEGQSDYFAALKCARNVFAEDNNVALMRKVKVPALAQKKCASAFKSAEEIALCLRTTMAGKALARTLQVITQEAIDKKYPDKDIKIPEPQLDTPDQREVEVTDNSHPLPQCRLDTMFQGAICHVGIDKDMDMADTEAGSCVRRLGDRDGVRPLCWFSPDSPAKSQPQLAPLIVGGLVN